MAAPSESLGATQPFQGGRQPQQNKTPRTFSLPSGVRKCSAPRKPCSSLRRPLGPPMVLGSNRGSRRARRFGDRKHERERLGTREAGTRPGVPPHHTTGISPSVATPFSSYVASTGENCSVYLPRGQGSVTTRAFHSSYILREHDKLLERAAAPLVIASTRHITFLTKPAHPRPGWWCRRCRCRTGTARPPASARLVPLGPPPPRRRC